MGNPDPIEVNRNFDLLFTKTITLKLDNLPSGIHSALRNVTLGSMCFSVFLLPRVEIFLLGEIITILSISFL